MVGWNTPPNRTIRSRTTSYAIAASGPGGQGRSRGERGWGISLQSLATMRAPLLLVSLLVPSLASQVISPIQATTVEGSASQQVPFNSGTARRHMQLHGDLPAQSAMITRLSFRQNGGNTVNFDGVRTIDLELFVANSSVPFDLPSTTFAANYTLVPTNAIARRQVTFGPQGVNSSPGPAPFNGMDLVFDAPFLYTAGSTFVWEAVIYSNTLNSGVFNALDADQGSLTPATVSATGAGCFATGRTLRMAQGLACRDMAGTLLFGVTASLVPANAPAVLALGTSNPNLAVPGLCSNLYTDLALLIPLPNSDANGLITADSGFGLVAANRFAGATLYSQIHALDVGRSDPIPICNSGGLATTFPASNLSKRVAVTRLLNNVGGTTATHATFAADTMVGYGLVTLFQ